ncbi:thioesterase family protein [Streptomyces sp. NPDC058067]|uniref:thioesterase family protein n=1 Tax=Streptomyces sp. NPDC058067 TaxID=3346324 RepID=UPI0036EA77A6
MTEGAQLNPGAHVPDSYYERIDEHRYKPTVHASGAWDPDELHFSPLGGLVVHAVERHLAERAADAGLTLGRISFDILGRLALDECEIQVGTVRPGRTIELVEATVLVAGRPVVRARAWLLATSDTSAVAGGAPAPLTPPDRCDPWDMASLWPGGYIASLDVRTLAPPRPGRTTAWVSTGLDLVAGETVSPLASYVGLVDTANGIAVRQAPTVWMYPNVDLTLHLHRQPEGRWTGLDTTVVFGGSGHGVTTTVLHDITGPVGYAHQMLTVRPQPPAAE